MKNSRFSYGMDMYRIRYGSGVFTCLIAQGPDQARELAKRAGDTVVSVERY
jgi:hypothetical protein